MTPDSIKKLAQLLSALPSIGPRQATRLAFHIAGMNTREVEELAKTIHETARLKRCTQCFRIDALEKTLCTICGNARRDHSTVAIIEKETDVLTLEKTKAFHGTYLVLGELTRDGILTTEQRRRLTVLTDNTLLKESVICFSPTTYGGMGAEAVTQIIKRPALIITRLARGIPTGGEIEFADEETLQEALKNRN